MSTVEIRGAFKHYGNKNDQCIVLNKLNMTVPEGAIYGLMGASGCGKTTLLSCIVGMIKLDGGQITTLGNEVSQNIIPKIGPRIGYMPQELALTNELTIKETIYYFGNIFCMDIEKLRERYEMLHKLLELPNGDKRVENCSGGEQRRVSFAAAMIHEPDLLILDEPTVGLDPILREKIWDFMLNITRTSKLSIIITTHYIEEAKQADYVGLMRNGILLAEDRPINITKYYKIESLEEAFLKLCISRGVSERATCVKNTNDINNEFEMMTKRNKISSIVKPVFDENSKTKKRTIRGQILRALLQKNFFQFKRSPDVIILLTILPLMHMLLFNFTAGRSPTGLRIGIIDEEIKSYDDCKNVTFIHKNDDDTCKLNLISCKMLDEITDDIATKIYYSTFDEAYQEVKRGKVIGFIHFTSSFTESTNAVREDILNVDDATREDSYIKVYMDHTDAQLNYFIQDKLINAYNNYSQTILAGCNLSVKLEKSPLTFLRPIYGADTNFTHTMFPAFTMLTVFASGVYLSIVGLIAERKEGLWNRTLLAGVSTIEMITSQIVVCIIILLIQLLEIFIVLLFVFNGHNHGSNITVFFLLGEIGFCGVFYGIFLACISKNFEESINLVTATILTLTLLSGLNWPAEGFPIAMKFIANLLPTSLPSVSLRNLFLKGYSFTHPSVFISFVIAFIWIIITFVIAVIALEKKKFSRNT